ncbi:MarR family transcriptional regulator [Staphylococcus massiliensis]|uniref:Transcriptional regulator n=1 Tax=Staphylococcus massiliensis S46 TaxID=1229783 RepID=K9AP45_9STAP|nr:MarR family transcriptional regulator [Staphylococcus massiliensis]EKU47791.1 transcriptional regulator [Staphylococcus massiliensis S46]MCG3399818.1 MarR family transcriptional regulator [Staphylococcus massiliensis]MCG3401555.1 MarR family transcriptional regulator [Staphylococcus massiliensis]MCG3413532.1 MarR family transcriptional regulator [Staphylococcus massiliensis]PNZ97108.1 MarR family transcriptional regulator [Staphylococcus massiliensis CCUG 55927]
MYKQLNENLMHFTDTMMIVDKRFGQRLNLTLEQLELLRTLYKFQNLSQYDLTMRINKEQSIVSRWIKKLVASKWITSKQSEYDKRCNILALSKKGRFIVEQLQAERLMYLEKKCAQLTQEDILKLSILIKKINYNE